jgi:hypothetical protein
MTYALLLDHKTLSFGWKQLAQSIHKHLYRRVR